MRRRDFLFVLGGAAVAWPVAGRAQQPDRVRRVGVLMGIANDPEGQARATVFQQALQKMGWMPNRNVLIDYRWAGGALDMQPYARELVGTGPDVILATNTTTAATLRQQTRTIPIAFLQVSDPLGSGLVTSLARPGGNLTGFTNFEFSMAGKWLEILKEVDARVARVAVLFNPRTAPYAQGYTRLVEAAGRALAVDVSTTTVDDAAGLDSAIAAIAQASNTGLIVMPDVFTTTHRAGIAALAFKHRLPAIYPFSTFIAAGGLISYGDDQLDGFRRAASYVDHILKGADLGELPIQQPIKFELIVNLKTANALGITIPQSILLRADEVIE